MVLRVTLIFLMFFASFAQAKRGSFKQAQKQFQKKQYSKSLKTLRNTYNFKKPKRIPASALFLIAFNYQKLGKYQEANYFYNQVIKNVYLKKHMKVVKAYRKNKVDEIELPKTLGMTYLNLGKSHYALFRKRGSAQSLKKARMYIKVCDETDSADECTDLLEKLDGAVKAYKLRRKKYEFYLQAGRLIFQDRINVEEGSTGLTSEVISNNSAVCYGAGLRRGSAIKGYDFSGCVFSGTTTVQGSVPNQGSDFSYAQSGVPIAGAYMEANYYYRFDEQKTRVAIGVPILYRAGSYSEPTGTTITVTDAQKTYFGLAFTAGFDLGWIEFQSKLAHMEKTNLLGLNFIYNF